MTLTFCRSIKGINTLYRLSRRYIYVLGIESSCDDTSAAVVNDSGEIIGESHYSQHKIHLEAGGIIPIIASNLHRQNIKKVVENSLKQNLLDCKDLHAIAVTVKPGLVLSLNAGLEYAKDLCTLYSKPMIPIHHMEAHALTARMIEDIKFPFLTFLISGGHCILSIVKSVDKFITLGTALDTSPGHVLDMIARRANLKNLAKFKGLVGGAAIEAAAANGDSSKFPFKTYILNFSEKNCNFSFSSILTHSRHFIKAEETKHNLGPDEVIPNINDLCAGVLLGMARHLCQRLEIAFHYIDKKQLLKENEKCLVLSGGVASNIFFQKALKMVCNHYGYKFVVPPPKLCTDNGVMIAWNGIERLKQGLPVVPPNELSSVTESRKKVYHETRCPLGEDISQDVLEVIRTVSFKHFKLRSYLEIANSNESSQRDFEQFNGSSRNHLKSDEKAV